MFTVVVTSLLENVSERNLNDQGILRKFLKSLKKIRNSIWKWKKTSKANHKVQRKLAKESIAAKLKSLRALGRLLVEARSNKVSATRNIEELKAAVSHLNHAITRKTRELKYWNLLCDNQAAVMKVFKDARNELKKEG